MEEIEFTIIDRDGVSHKVSAPTNMNLNLMEVCKLYELPVKGECGGMAMCATCQIYVESDTRLKSPSDAELDMLDQAFYVRDNSRLGCQIYISKDVQDIIVRLAPEQD
jgi:2Fe-2S ferredoxin